MPYCLLIQKYTEKILRYTAPISKDKFVQQGEIYDACLLNLIHIAEAIKSLSKKFTEENPAIPYRKIIGLRNIAAHN